MANIDAKRTIRTFKDFSLGLSANGGGSVVVTELPEVGDEHTIYELQEKKVILPVVVMSNQAMVEDHVSYENTDYFFVFNTYEEMNNIFTSIIPEEDPTEIYLNYITEEDKLIGAIYEKGAWKFTEARKISNCKFSIGAIFELEDDEYVAILKEYLGHSTGTLWNGESYTFEREAKGVVLGTPTIGIMVQTECDENLEELPSDTPSEKVFETIPYEKIINFQLENNQWYFTPKDSGEITVISYWIYTNDKWVNVDEIDTNPPLHKTVFGTLTDTGDIALQCSLTLEEMADAIAQGNFVVLELNMGDESKENYYYCAVSEVTVGGEAPDSATIIATWSFMQGSIEWNPSVGAFVFNNGIM